MKPTLFSRPLDKVWRHRPPVAITKGDIVWFFASSHDGVNQECLTGIVLACKVINTVGKKDGEDNEIYIIRIGYEDWFVDAARVFEYWEDCDREARTFTRWAKHIRSIASECTSSVW